MPLLILWWILFGWFMFLISVFPINAAPDINSSFMPYTWVNDDTEVLYRVSFMEPNNSSENILNEMYAKDTSVKIKSARKTRFQNGEFMTA